MPQAGYPDWQRVQNWDGPVLWQTNVVQGTVQQSSGLLDVSRFHTLSLYVDQNIGNATLFIEWFFDSAGTIASAARTIYLSALVNGGSFLRLPNLGASCKIFVQPIAGGNFETTLIAAGSNRVAPTEAAIPQDTLVRVLNQPLAASGVVQFYPNFLYSGPVRTWFSAPAAGWYMQIQSIDGNGNWQYVHGFTSAGTGDNSLGWVMPPSACRFQVTNPTAAAGNFYLVATPSTAGAI